MRNKKAPKVKVGVDKAELIKNKRDVSRIVEKVYKELKNSKTHIIFKNLRGSHGEYNVLEDEIYIDIRKEILPTIIHELLHKWHPEKSEKQIVKQEKYIMKYLTLNQGMNILSLMLTRNYLEVK